MQELIRKVSLTFYEKVFVVKLVSKITILLKKTLLIKLIVAAYS
jgi:hypothetical protein